MSISFSKGSGMARRLLVGALVLNCLFFAVACGGGGGGGGGGGDQDFDIDACSAIGLKVANGVACVPGDNPSESSFVRLDIDGFFGNRTCTGVALDQTTVLTAGHCFEDDYFQIGVATYNGTVTASFAVLHPGFDSSGFESGGVIANDFALVITEQPMNINVSPILVSRAPIVGEEAVVAGFGLTSPNSSAGEMHAGNAIITDVTAQHVMIKFEGNQAHPCGGDSGSPLLVSAGGTFAIVGTVSQSDPSVPNSAICRPGDFTLYGNTQDASVLGFIESFAPGAVKL